MLTGATFPFGELGYQRLLRAVCDAREEGYYLKPEKSLQIRTDGKCPGGNAQGKLRICRNCESMGIARRMTIGNASWFAKPS